MADVRKYVIGRTLKKDGKKDKIRRPKIQRLVTPQSLARRRAEYVVVSLYDYHPCDSASSSQCFRFV